MKAILVIDMPESVCIEECKVDLKIYDFKRFRGYKIYDFNDKGVLKPMPQKKNEKDVEKVYSTNDRSWTNGFSDGYNYCIDEILGE